MIEPHFQHQQPPKKPTSYREYRLMKEEAEKKRREMEERMLQEETARQEAAAAAAAREMKENSPVTEPAEERQEEKEEKKEARAVEQKIEPKVKEVKDPRKKKLLEEKKRSKSEVEEKKPTENKKSFKIPKVKKSETESKGMKLEEIDMFQPMTPSEFKKKSTKVEEVKEKSSSKSKKVEKGLEAPEVPEKAEDATHQPDGATDSDSEPSLTIAEDLEDRMASRSSASESESERSDKSEVVKNKENTEETDTKSDEGVFTKNELTKELLKSIVSSLEPLEAAKLLEKASTLKKDDKITVSALKSLLDSKEEAEEDSEDEILSKKRKRGRPKTPTKENSSKKVKTENKGSRRSQRLVVEEEREESAEPEGKEELGLEMDTNQESIETPVEQVEQVETFVIEPKAVALPKKVKKKRGRKAKVVESSEIDTGLQDDSISSSNIEDQIPDPKEEPSEIKLEPPMDTLMEDGGLIENITEVKAEVEEEEESLAPLPRRPSDQETGMRQTRSMRSKVKKTKTWKPADLSENKKEFSGLSCLKSPPLTESQIKMENVVADMKVFVGEGEVSSETFTERKFTYSKAEFDRNQLSDIKSRKNSILSILDKFSKSCPEPKKELSVERKLKSADTEVLCSKIKLSKPPTGADGQLLNPPELKTHLNINSLKLSSRITEALMKESVVADEENPLEAETEEPPKLLELIHSLKKDEKEKDIDSDSVLKSLDLQENEIHNFARESVVTSPDIRRFKDEETLQLMLSKDSLVHLFKCMSPTSSFSTNSAEDFLSYLSSHKGPRDSLLRCCYCFGRVRTPEKLVNHIIKHHGNCRFQCLYSFQRFRSPTELLLHQNYYFENLPKGFLYVDHIQEEKMSRGRVSFSNKMKCLAVNCSFECQSSDRKSIQDHKYKHFGQQEMIGYYCPYCDFSSTSHIKLLLHQSQVHPGLTQEIHMRRIELAESEESDLSSSDDVDIESDVDSELSDFDKHFYDDDSDSPSTEESGKLKNSTMEETGLKDRELYRCGNPECHHSSTTASEYKDHLLKCPHYDPLMPYSCPHCPVELNHLQSLLEHLKTHALKRYHCSLCNFKDPLVSGLKTHAKAAHKMISYKIIPVNSYKNNHDRDFFMLVPKNNSQKYSRSKSVKDTYSPFDVDSIPVKPEIYKQILRCSVCDFGTRVKNNLVKHLRLHIKNDKIEQGQSNKEKISVPVIGPVNPPSIEESEASATAKMSSLLPDDIDEELRRKPLTAEELSVLPKFVPENLRFACCAKDCSYVSADEGMLFIHMKSFHKELRKYKCPHCINVSISFQEVPQHLRLHGEQLFRCPYCDYFHYVKRTAEAHVVEEHEDRKQFVKNVREDQERLDRQTEEPVKTEKPDKEDVKTVAVYEPYKCALCDFSSEFIDEIRKHLLEVHDISHQYKCGHCNFFSDSKKEMEEHFESEHPGVQPCLVRLFSIDPSSVEYYPEERRFPLWSRHMEGLKHIRGILYDELEDEAGVKPVQKVKARKRDDPDVDMTQDLLSVEKVKPSKKSSEKIELDTFSVTCRECGTSKKTVTGMKMHIKLNHLQVGKFQCQHCVFSANLTNSIQGHYRNKHPEYVSIVDGRETFDYAEKTRNAQNFGEQFWKDNWDLPTVEERKRLLKEISSKRKSSDDSDVTPKKPKGAKRGRKRKSEIIPEQKSEYVTPSEDFLDDFDANILRAEKVLREAESSKAPVSTLSAVEVSPFESVKSFMCSYCPKRSQNLERIKRHHAECHADKSLEFQELTRDQVVNIITSDQYAATGDKDYKCFYCQEIGSIRELQEHNDKLHHSGVFRVVRFQSKGVTGYLECQVCGYLSPGFEKYFQKAHFHEEHPLENEVNCSKYMNKVKGNVESFSGSQQTFKVCIDLR